MTRRKEKQVHCIFFVKKKFTRRDIKDWCRENKKKYNITINMSNDEIMLKDKDYKVVMRPRSRFKRIEKKNMNGIRILRGYLK